MKSLHTVRKKVSWQERHSILPKSVWDKYAGKEFWRPQTPDYSMKSTYKLVK